MTDPNLMPVRLEVVKEMLVERILGEALARYPGRPPAAVERALHAPLSALEACDGGGLDLRLRRVGYLCRVAERAMFDPAQDPLPGLAERIAARLGDGEDRTATGEAWTAAATAISAELAADEPLERPRPTDERAVSWKVPGPGGHVRHYVVAAAISDGLTDVLASEPAAPDANHDGLKRAWLYGFLVRCCEEANPPPLG